MNGKGQGLVVPIDTRRTGDELTISIGAGTVAGIGKADVVVVYFRENQTVEVLKGENTGQKLNYWHSVTDVQTVGMWDARHRAAGKGHRLRQERRLCRTAAGHKPRRPALADHRRHRDDRKAQDLIKSRDENLVWSGPEALGGWG